MKPRASLRYLLGCPIIALLAAQPLQAITYYWDNNGTTSGYGTAGGTWAAPTVSQWSTSNVGTATPGASITTTTADTINFGLGTAGNGLGSGTISVSGTVNTGNITFGSQSGAITLSGGKISLGGGRTITSNNTGNVISSELELTGNSTVSLAFPGGGTPASSSITFGVISGTGNMVFQNTAGMNPNPARFIINGQSSYSGTTLLDSTNTNANIALAIGVTNALPTGTVLTIDGGDGTGSGRTANFELNGYSQTLGGLTNTAVSLRTQNVLNTSGTLSTLTINDSGNRTFSGRIGAGGTNIAIVKQGAGNWTLSGTNSYTGTTTINGGAITVSSATALGSTAGGTVVNGTNTAGTANARVQLSGGVTVTGEAITISGHGNFNGALTSISGNNVWAGDVTIGAAGTRIGASAGASLEISGTIDSGANPHGVIIRTADLTGSVIFSGANTYLGSTQVLIGKLQLAGGDNRLPVGTTLTFGSSGSNPDAEFDLNGRNQEVAGLTMTGDATQNSVNNSSGTLSTLTVNTASSPSTYGGILKGNLGITKEGTNSLTLTGTSNTYTGETKVNQGTLIVNGNISTSLLTTVASGATIAGSGAVGALTIESGGAIAPGNSPGILDTGDYTQAGTYNLEINGLTAGTDHDQIDVTGTVDITAGSLNITSFTGAYSANDLIFILLNDLSDSITGTYTGFAQGAVVASYGGFDWQISYEADSVGGTFTGGNDIALMAVPEPGAALLGGIGVLLLFRRRRA